MQKFLKDSKYNTKLPEKDILRVNLLFSNFSEIINSNSNFRKKSKKFNNIGYGLL